MDIRLVDLKAQKERIGQDMERAVQNVLDHGKYIMGPEIGQLEKELSIFTGAKYVVACSSGTDALLLALMARGVGPGDAVFTTPFTFIATAEVITLLGAIPVFVDIDEETFNIRPDHLERKIDEYISKGTGFHGKCVIPVDLFGLPADYEKIHRIAREYGMHVIEDAAQSLGSEFNGKRAGTFGDIAATSFFPAKPLGCYGDGGAVFTNDPSVYETVKSIRVHGSGSDKYSNVRIGLNARMDTIQAAVLLEKLKIFDEELHKRRKIAARYTERLQNIAGLRFQKVPGGYKSAWAQFSIICDKRDLMMERLKEKGIPCAVYYPTPLHLQQAFSGLGYGTGDFPVSEEISEKIFSIPVHPYLTDSQVDYICDTVIEAACN